MESSRLGSTVAETPIDEVLFHDITYDPPVAITQAVIAAAGLAPRQLSVYTLHARGYKFRQIAEELGMGQAAVRSARPRAASKVKNVLRAEGLIVSDGVPVPLHRRGYELDERTARIAKRLGL